MALEKMKPEYFRQQQMIAMIAKECRERIMYAVCVKMSCAPFDIVDALATPVEDRNTVQISLIAEWDALGRAVAVELVSDRVA